MTWKQFVEWRVFNSLEPFDETRNDWRFAALSALLANLLGRNPDGAPFKPEDFILHFGDNQRESKKKDWRDLKMVVDTYAEAWEK